MWEAARIHEKIVGSRRSPHRLLTLHIYPAYLEPVLEPFRAECQSARRLKASKSHDSDLEMGISMMDRSTEYSYRIL